MVFHPCHLPYFLANADRDPLRVFGTVIWLTDKLEGSKGIREVIGVRIVASLGQPSRLPPGDLPAATEATPRVPESP
jgi:hypothetical protein